MRYKLYCYFVLGVLVGRRGLISRDKIPTFSADSVGGGLPHAFPQHFPRLHQKCRFWYIAIWRQGPAVPYFVTSFCKAVRFHRLFKLCSALASTSATSSTTFRKQKCESIFFYEQFLFPSNTSGSGVHGTEQACEDGRLKCHQPALLHVSWIFSFHNPIWSSNVPQFFHILPRYM